MDKSTSLNQRCYLYIFKAFNRINLKGQSCTSNVVQVLTRLQQKSNHFVQEKTSQSNSTLEAIEDRWLDGG